MLNSKMKNMIIRTGDHVTLKSGKKILVHYVVNEENQLSFDEPISKIKNLICDCGDKIQHVCLNDLIFN